MIAVLVTFAGYDPGWDAEEVVRRLEPTVPAYAGRARLRTKTYWFDQDAQEFGAFYIWEDAEAARDHYDQGWMERVRQRFGVEPCIRFLEVPFHIDNVAAEVITQQAAPAVGSP